MHLIDGKCRFDECEGPYISNFYPDKTYDKMPFGQLLQAAICVDQNCTDNYGSFHVGCKLCTSDENPENWEYCLDCTFEETGSISACSECDDGWVLREDGQGCD